MSLKNRISILERQKGSGIPYMEPVIIDFVCPETREPVARWRVHPGTAEKPGYTETVKMKGGENEH